MRQEIIEEGIMQQLFVKRLGGVDGIAQKLLNRATANPIDVYDSSFAFCGSQRI